MINISHGALATLLVASLAGQAPVVSGEQQQNRFEEPVTPSPGAASQPSADDAAAAYKQGDYATAIRLIQPDAEAGVASAQLLLGMIYVQGGDGVTQDDAEAVKWFGKAAAQGDDKAQFNLGLMYEKGRGAPQNYAEAVKWYRKAAERGHIAAQTNLATMYAGGHGVPLNNAEAVRWFRKAAEQDDPVSQFNLGVAYAKGLGVKRDTTQAYLWFSLASDNGQKAAAGARDQLATTMTPYQIAEAKKLVRNWKPKKSTTS